MLSSQINSANHETEATFKTTGKMKHKTAKIQDVARVAGVSTATVSRALSNPQKLSEATLKAVSDAISATGYRINKTAQSLRRQKANAILVCVPNLGNPFFSQILSGISKGFSSTKYSVLITDSQHLDQKEMRIIDSFSDGTIDGMICLDGNFKSDQLDKFSAFNVDDKIVFACEWVDNANYPSIRSDNEKGAKLAFRHLYDLGHRKIAHVTGPENNVLTLIRRDSLNHERERLGLPFNPEWIIRGDFSVASGVEAGHRILDMKDRPTAVFCASDEVAFGLISALTSAGLNVPKDISVVGFDDISLADNFVPALTTIRQNRKFIGLKAAEKLSEILEQNKEQKNPYSAEIVDVELIVRASTSRIHVYSSKTY
jgi:LacI family repressor for deo operon, udp, cdd, tsx, nupC, and nupG